MADTDTALHALSPIQDPIELRGELVHVGESRRHTAAQLGALRANAASVNRLDRLHLMGVVVCVRMEGYAKGDARKHLDEVMPGIGATPNEYYHYNRVATMALGPLRLAVAKLVADATSGPYHTYLCAALARRAAHPDADPTAPCEATP